MFKRVLVTGGAGFIGSHMVDALIARGCEVRIFDSLDPQVHGEAQPPPIHLNHDAEFIRGSVLDRRALASALRGCDAVVHDAAAVGVGQSQYQIAHYVSTNTLGTANLLDIIVSDKLPVERLLVASSMSIYGEGAYRRPSDGRVVFPSMRREEQLRRHEFELLDGETGEVLTPIPTPEGKPLDCTSVYALSKRDQEEYTLMVARTHGLSAVACRFFNVYGTRQSLSNPYTGVAAIFSARYKNGNAPIIYEDGGQSRDFIDVRDIVAAKLALLENPHAVNESYNICTGRPTSVLEVARLLAGLHGCEDLEPQIVNRFRTGDIRHCIGDNSKLRALGWEPRITLEDGMRHLFEWSREQEARDSAARAHDELLQRGLVSD